jgi:hypothetical protein
MISLTKIDIPFPSVIAFYITQNVAQVSVCHGLYEGNNDRLSASRANIPTYNAPLNAKQLALL